VENGVFKLTLRLEFLAELNFRFGLGWIDR
jgi:hypothetical protein